MHAEPVTRNKACFSYAAIALVLTLTLLVARDECSTRRRSQNEMYGTLSCVSMKDVTRSGRMGIIMIMTVFQCQPGNCCVA